MSKDICRSAVNICASRNIFLSRYFSLRGTKPVTFTLFTLRSLCHFADGNEEETRKQLQRKHVGCQYEAKTTYDTENLRSIAAGTNLERKKYS